MWDNRKRSRVNVISLVISLTIESSKFIKSNAVISSHKHLLIYLSAEIA